MGYFPTVGGATIGSNLDWPTATTELLRVVNNSDNMNEEVWEWWEASHQALDYCTVSLAAGWHCESIQSSIYETVNGRKAPYVQLNQYVKVK